MIGLIATLKIQPGKEAEFEAAAREMVERVNADEPGCEYYRLYRGEEAGTYVMMERYKDEAALAAHRASDHYKAVGPRLREFVAAPVEVQVLKLVA